MSYGKYFKIGGTWALTHLHKDATLDSEEYNCLPVRPEAWHDVHVLFFSKQTPPIFSIGIG
jgi:uncharacterized protein YuzB (UPF0349 family)